MTGFNKKSNYQELIRGDQEHAKLIEAWDGQALLCTALQIYLLAGDVYRPLKGGEVVEDRSRVTRKREERKSSSGKRKALGVATLGTIVGLEKAIISLKLLWEFLMNL